MNPINPIDPSLLPLVTEQREFVRSLKGPFAPPPDKPLPVLPARLMSLPTRPDVKLRILVPTTAINGVYLHIHGGGFVHGDAAMGDVANSSLATAAHLAIVSIDYRLAPQHIHPAAVDDCEAAALWLIEHAAQEFGTEQLLIGGESVGASLAALTLLRLRDRHQAQQHFCGANLALGNYDFSMTPSQRASTPSLFLSPQHLAEMRAAVFPGKSLEELRVAEVSPLYADLRGLPSALFSVGTQDAVLDDSIFMAARWSMAGNEAELAVYPEAPHLFMTYPTRMAEVASLHIVDFMRARIK